jgi:YesN/AraC family two-component response regulator
VDIVVPLIVKGVGIGVLTSGQFLFSKPSKRVFDRMKRRIRQLDINLPAARKNFFALPVIDRNRAKDIVSLISIIVEYVVEAEGRILELRDTYHKDVLRQVQQYVESEYKKSISLNHVASAVHISTSRLAHIIREKLNMNFTSYLNEIRIEKAKFLLCNTQLSIKEIAYDVGFRNLSHFNHLFKRVTALSPSEYRYQ